MVKKKILIVDDDKKLTDIVQKYFIQYEFNVVIINDGKDVDQVVDTEKPDIILLDLMLPGKNGLDLLKDLQKKVDVPIIMLTAKGE